MALRLVAVLSGAAGAANVTHCAEDFCTWWHSTGEINTKGRVENGNVRQSHKYIVQVSSAGSTTFYDSFVYESIPRNGNGRIYSPWDSPGSDTLPDNVDDGITRETEIGRDGATATMAWSQFEYAQDVDVRIRPRDPGATLTADGLKIRPARYAQDVVTRNVDDAVVIRIPFDPNGRRLSIEFKDDLVEYRSDGTNYVPTGGDVVGEEPGNALLIFASPFLPHDVLPWMSTDSTKTMVPGPINNEDWGSAPILYFPPGVYWMNQGQNGDQPKYGQNHMRLHKNTYHVHLAPGAYIKGAIEYSSDAKEFYATGHGVLSGEHYVYQANAWDGLYQANKSDGTSLRMWWQHSSVSGQVWHCVGPTIANPPFNTMDFHATDVSVRISDYKQVGAWFFQTDGPQMYPDSIVHDVFYHVNDDALKTYHSRVSVSRATIWKCHNDPVIQMGWSIWNDTISDVNIDSLDVIHTRYIKSEMGDPSHGTPISAIIGASGYYEDGHPVDASKSISLNIRGLTCEGSCPALLGITPVQSYRNFLIEDVNFPDGLQRSSLDIGQSHVGIPEAPDVRMELHIKNWRVGGEQVTMSNFQAADLGQFNINAKYWGQWSIDGASGVLPVLV